MPARRLPRTQTHPYGWAYQQARARLLADSPPCHWQGPRCTGVATTADHEPPIEIAGPHLNLVPACQTCNYGRRGRTPERANAYPGPSREW